MREPAMEVLIGPSIDLHPGAHGALLHSPPPGVRYRRSSAVHTFLFPRGSATLSPYLSPHCGELVRLTAIGKTAHSSRWPLLHCTGWLADTDDFGYPVVAGRFALHPEFPASLNRMSREFERVIQSRAATMLHAYAHPSCVGVLFRTEATARTARAWLQDLGVGPAADRFLEKMRVAYPVRQAAPPSVLDAKWAPGVQRQVVFCGRNFKVKNGRTALDLFLVLARKFPDVRFIYVGDIPREDASHQALRAGCVEARGVISSREMELLLNRSHILFHPSQFEGVGLILLEAMASGLAVVCATGKGMSEVGEFLSTDGALFVDREEICDVGEPAAFLQHLRFLLRHPRRAESMGRSNHHLCSHGKLSVAHRDATLLPLYELASQRTGPALTMQDLPAAVAVDAVTLTSGELQAAYRAFQDALQLAPGRQIEFARENRLVFGSEPEQRHDMDG